MKALCLVCLLPLLFFGCRKDKPFTCHITGRAVMANDHSRGVAYAVIIYATDGSSYVGASPTSQQAIRTDANGNFTMDVPNCKPGQIVTLYGQKDGFYDPLDNYYQIRANSNGNTVDVPMKMLTTLVLHIKNIPPADPLDSVGFGPGYPFDNTDTHSKPGIGLIDTFWCCDEGAIGFDKHISWSVITHSNGRQILHPNGVFHLREVAQDTLELFY